MLHNLTWWEFHPSPELESPSFLSVFSTVDMDRGAARQEAGVRYFEYRALPLARRPKPAAGPLAVKEVTGVASANSTATVATLTYMVLVKLEAVGCDAYVFCLFC